MDLACRDFEAASGALLNRNRKTTIMGLGSWGDRQDWPLQWILASTSVKVLGFTISPVFSNTVQLSWDSVLWKGENFSVLEDTEAGDSSAEGPGPGVFCPLQGLVHCPPPSTGHLTRLPWTDSPSWPLSEAGL